MDARMLQAERLNLMADAPRSWDLPAVRSAGVKLLDIMPWDYDDAARSWLDTLELHTKGARS